MHSSIIECGSVVRCRSKLFPVILDACQIEASGKFSIELICAFFEFGHWSPSAYWPFRRRKLKKSRIGLGLKTACVYTYMNGQP